MLGNTQTRHAATRRITLATALFLTTTALVSLTPLSAVAQTGAVSPSAQSFAISARPLGEALLLFSHQTHLQITSQGPMLTGRRSTAVSGHFTPSEALTRLLSGTGLTFRSEAGGAIQIVPASANITLGPVRVGGTLAHQDPTGPGVGYFAENTMAATKTDTPLTEIPNSIYVVTKQQMVDQQPQSVVEALRYTPGVYSEATGTYGNGSNGAGTGASGIFQRGFKTTPYVDGLLFNSASSGETAFIERVQAINGPASVMYGQVNPGGMIAIDLKKPTETPLHQASLGFGSWHRYEATLDMSDKLTKSGNLRYRIAAIGVTQGTQVDYLSYHRVGVLPSLTWDIDHKTSLTLLGMYMYTPGDGSGDILQYPLYGTLIRNREYPEIPRSNFLGLPNWNIEAAKEAMFEYQFKHDFNKWISFSQTFRLERSENVYKNIYQGDSSRFPIQVVHPWELQGRTNTAVLDSRVSGHFSVGSVKNTWIVGSDFRQYHYDQDALYQFKNPVSIDVYNPRPNYQPCLNFQTLGCGNYKFVGQYDYFQEGVYFQDQIKWRGLSLLLGGREDWVNYSSHNIHYSKSGNSITSENASLKPQAQTAFTWRAGVIYNSKIGLNPYFSYATSFVPQNSTNWQGTPFAPLTGKQLEAGLKYKIPNKDILLTASAFHIDEDHYLISDLVHTGYSNDGGRVRSQGFELSANANITPNLRAIASYTFTDIRFAKTNKTARRINIYNGSYDGSAVSQQGMFVPQVPRNMTSLFLDYTIPKYLIKGLGINWGIRYVGFTYGDNVESFKTKPYTLFDLGAHYDFGEAVSALHGLQARIAVSNLTNKYYVTSCQSATCYVGQGRRIYGNLTYNW